jgi:hypothetical protein
MRNSTLGATHADDGGCLGRRAACDQGSATPPARPSSLRALAARALRDRRILAPRLEPTGQKRAARPSRRTVERQGARSRPGDGRGSPSAMDGGRAPRRTADVLAAPLARSARAPPRPKDFGPAARADRPKMDCSAEPADRRAARRPLAPGRWTGVALGVEGLGVGWRATNGLGAPLVRSAHSAGAGRARAWARPGRAHAAPERRLGARGAAPVPRAQTAPGARAAPGRAPGAHRARAVLRPCRAHRRRPAPVPRAVCARAAPVQNFDISHSTFVPPGWQRGGCSAYIVGGGGRASVPPGGAAAGQRRGLPWATSGMRPSLGHAPRSPKLAPWASRAGTPRPKDFGPAARADRPKMGCSAEPADRRAARRPLAPGRWTGVALGVEGLGVG